MDTIFEQHSGDHIRQPIGAVEQAPFFLCRLHQFVDSGQNVYHYVGPMGPVGRLPGEVRRELEDYFESAAAGLGSDEVGSCLAR